MLWLLLAACSTSDQGPRSIVFITLDTVRADHLRLYGGRAETPNIEALAEESVRFRHAYSHYPQTPQSHWVMFTSALPDAHGDAIRNGTSDWRGPTLATLARQAGYATGAFIGGPTLRKAITRLGRDFEVYDDHFQSLADGFHRPAKEITERAVAYIKKQDGPYLCFVHYFDAHAPYTPADPRRYAPEYRGMMNGTKPALDQVRRQRGPLAEVGQAMALYDAEITEMDQALAPLFAALRGDEIVVITSDHGESFEHGYYFNHAEVLYDSVMHVPLVIRAPGVPARWEEAQVGHVDLLPTLVKLAGWPMDPGFMGAPLLPDTPERREIWARSDMEDVLPAKVALRLPEQKLIWERSGRSYRYDLRADPDELQRLGIDDLDADSRRAALAAAISSSVYAPTTRSAAPDLDPETVRQLGELGYTVPAPPAPPAPPPAPAPAPPGSASPANPRP